MVKKYLVFIALAVITIFGAVTQTARAHSNTTQTNATPSETQSIWCGLWSGVNLDFGGRNCGNTAQQQTTQTTQPPNRQPSTTIPTTPNSARPIYAALGDSVAAGLGLPAPANAEPGMTFCGRSSQSYAYQVAAATNMTLRHGACSGATVGDLFTKQGVNGPNITAQLDYAYAAGTPSLITITAGANDAHWDEFIRGCYASRCANGVTTSLANGYLVALQAKLYVAFTSIQLRSNGAPPPVIVTGYYNPLSTACTQYQSNITADEIAWLAAETAALNQTIKDVSSKYSFVTYVPVDFSEHDICSGSSWIQGLADKAPFHPTAAGQQAIARSVLSSIGK